MSKFYVIGKASPELLKKMHADPNADRGAVMKSMCDSYHTLISLPHLYLR